MVLFGEMMSVAGFNRKGDNYFHARASVDPPAHLVSLVFPFMEDAKDYYEDRPNPAFQGIYALFRQLVVVLLQDSVILKTLFPHLRIWTHVVFARLEYKHFEKKLLAVLKSDAVKEPVGLQIKNLTPVIPSQMEGSNLKTKVFGDIISEMKTQMAANYAAMTNTIASNHAIMVNMVATNADMTSLFAVHHAAISNMVSTNRAAMAETNSRFLRALTTIGDSIDSGFHISPNLSVASGLSVLLGSEIGGAGSPTSKPSLDLLVPHPVHQDRCMARDKFVIFDGAMMESPGSVEIIWKEHSVGVGDKHQGDG